jgi:uncharacterized protein
VRAQGIIKLKLSYYKINSDGDSLDRSIWKQLAIFFTLAYAITWALSLPPTVMSASDPLFLIGGILLHYGPLFAAITTLAIYSDGWSAIKRTLKRVLIWRFSIKWYLFIMLLPIAIRALSVAINVFALGQSAPAFFTAPGSVPAGNPLVLLTPVFVSIIFQAGIAEEIGWRGFALPRLQQKYNALAASIVLGLIWSFWHFYPLNWNTLLPIAPYYVILTVTFSIMITCVFNNTKGSVLATILFHSASNLSDWIIPTSFTSGSSSFDLLLIRTIINTAVAVGLIAAFGAKNLSRQPRVKEGIDEAKRGLA